MTRNSASKKTMIRNSRSFAEAEMDPILKGRSSSRARLIKASGGAEPANLRDHVCCCTAPRVVQGWLRMWPTPNLQYSDMFLNKCCPTRPTDDSKVRFLTSLNTKKTKQHYNKQESNDEG